MKHRNRIFVKGFEFSTFAKNISENLSKNVSMKYSQKPFDHAN